MSINPRVVIIGTGWGIKIQVPAFQHAGWDIEAVVSRSQSSDESADQPYKVIPESELMEALKSPLVKLATITTPPITHSQHFRSIIESNKQSQSKVHILCEKPFAMSLAEAKSMVNELRQNQLENDKLTGQSLTQVDNQFSPFGWIDHELRCLKAVKVARDFIQSQEFGPVHSVTILHMGSLSVKPAYSWWNDSSLRGGVLGAVGSHMIDLLHFLTNSSIDQVSAQLHTAQPDKVDTATGQSKTATSDDYASFVGTAISKGPAEQHKFPLTITVSSNSGGFLSRKSCIVAGRNQSIELDLETLIVTAWVEGKKQTLIDGQDYVDSEVESIKLPKNPFAAGTVLLARRLREIVTNSNPVQDADLATYADGLKVQAVMDAVYQSVDGRSVKVAY